LKPLYFLLLAKFFSVRDFRLREPIEYCMRKIPKRTNQAEATRKLRKSIVYAKKCLTSKRFGQSLKGSPTKL